jgi:hypothetical protein
LVPEIARYSGMNFDKLVEEIILDASLNKWRDQKRLLF